MVCIGFGVHVGHQLSQRGANVAVVAHGQTCLGNMRIAGGWYYSNCHCQHKASLGLKTGRTSERAILHFVGDFGLRTQGGFLLYRASAAEGE